MTGVFSSHALRRLFALSALCGAFLASPAAWAAPAQQHGDEAHEGGHHVPSLSDVNWFHGMLGEREGVTPSFLWRSPGTPAPVGAMLFNTAILLWLVVRFGGPAIRSGLTSRKQRVESGISAAANMKREAEEQLAHYESKLARVDQEIERVRTEMREQAETERKRVLAEAAVRRQQMERDAQILLAQELKAARETLFHEVVAEAIKSAEATVRAQLGADDQRRLAEAFLEDIDRALEVGGSEVRS